MPTKPEDPRMFAHIDADLPNRIVFIAQDGRTMFEAWVGKDGHSVEFRSVEYCNVGGIVYDTQLTVEPRSSNVLVISVQRYEP